MIFRVEYRIGSALWRQSFLIPLLQLRPSTGFTTLALATPLSRVQKALFIASCWLISSIGQADVQRSHALSLYGSAKYEAEFSHFDYVNPSAPKGGTVRLMATGTFDTLNPYTLKGISPVNTPGFYLFAISESNETLMMGTDSLNRSGDEPLTGYGLIAESIEYPENFSWVTFHLRPEARFHDHHPIQAEDVLFSYETLIKEGHPRYRLTYRDVSSAEVIGPQSIRFTLQGDSRKRLAITLGELPVLPKHYWKNREFSSTTLTPPLGSGPYRIESLDPGRSINFERVRDYWGANLAVNKGRFNFDRVRFDFYRDLTVAFEAFKAHQYDLHLEYIAKNWATGYDFNALHNKQVIKHEIPHQIPAVLQGFFFNTRKELFASIQTREALTLLFDFEWANRSLFHNAYLRSNSYFANSGLASSEIPGKSVQEILAGYDSLGERVIKEKMALPITQGNGNQRTQIRQALHLLKESGWELKQGKLRHSKTHQPFQFEILVRQQSLSRILVPYQQSLKKVGIDMQIRLIDSAQYKNRMDNFDFDMTTIALGQALAPGDELRQYFHSSQADTIGGQNYAGINNPTVDDLIEKLLAADDRQSVQKYGQALDRVLLSQYYMVPNWYINYHRVAHWNLLDFPESIPPYDFGFSNWWIKPDTISSSE